MPSKPITPAQRRVLEALQKEPLHCPYGRVPLRLRRLGITRSELWDCFCEGWVTHPCSAALCEITDLGRAVLAAGERELK